MGESRPKAFVQLDRQTILDHALARIRKLSAVGLIVVVVPADQLPATREATDDDGHVHVVVGGAQRSDSVRAGLAHVEAVAPGTEIVLVHDAARPLTPPEVFDRVIAAVRAGHAAVVPGQPVVDTLKRVVADDAGGHIVADTVDRAALRAVQTPQGFALSALLSAYEAAGETATDDAGLAERRGIAVHVVDGDPLAFKITTPWDLRIARSVVAEAVDREQR